MKTILITGGAGFIGSNFVRYLLQTEPAVTIVNLGGDNQPPTTSTSCTASAHCSTSCCRNRPTGRTPR